MNQKGLTKGLAAVEGRLLLGVGNAHLRHGGTVQDGPDLAIQAAVRKADVVQHHALARVKAHPHLPLLPFHQAAIHLHVLGASDRSAAARFMLCDLYGFDELAALTCMQCCRHLAFHQSMADHKHSCTLIMIACISS